MECKSIALSEIQRFQTRINRNIVECKLGTTVDKIGNVKELIETLWNVNALRDNRRETPEGELIETLWNVNDKL